jgi:hypothetical protein
VRKELFAISIIFLFLIAGCLQKNEFSNTPELRFIGMSKDSLMQGFSKEDSIVFLMELTDGDGDIGFGDGDTLSESILITDLRTGNISEQFNIPKIPENVVVNGLQAEMQLKLFTTCCLLPENIPPCDKSDKYPYDTLQYEIIIIDRAGNKSEPVLTPPIILICN